MTTRKTLEQMAQEATRERMAEDDDIQVEPWCMKMNGCKTKCEDCPDEPAPKGFLDEVDTVGKFVGDVKANFLDEVNRAQPVQEPVAWLEPEWREKICPEVGYEVTMTDDHPRDLCWIPLYPHPPQRTEQEPVAWLTKNKFSGEVDLDAKNAKETTGWSAAFPVYTTPQQRPWVGLTEAQFLEATRLAENGNYLVAFVRIQEWLKEQNT